MGVRKIAKPQLSNKGEEAKVTKTAPVVEEPEIEEVYEDEFFDEEEVEEEVEEIEEEQPIDAPPIEIKKRAKSDKKEIFQKVEKTKIVKGKVTKRDDLLKIVLEELENKGMTTTITNLDTVFKAIENAISYSLDNGAPVFLLGNQIGIKQRKARVAIVPNQPYDTLTGEYTAYSWSKLGERETIRGKYNKQTKEFTAEDGTVYKLD